MNDIVAFNENPDIAKWELIQRKAKALSSATIVPKEYQNNLGNAIIAIEVAQRIGANELMVMQNLYIVHGRPSWSSQFIIAAINTCGRFHPLKFDLQGEGDDRTCIAWTKDKETGDRLESPPVSIKMAKAEGWYQKNGSKWQTMPELMLRYRSASFFGRLYAPDVLMGMYSDDEAREMKDITPYDAPTIINDKPKINAVDLLEAAAQPAEVFDTATGEIIDDDTETSPVEADTPATEVKPLATLEQLIALPYTNQTQIKTLCKASYASIEGGAVTKLDFMQAFPDLPDAAGRAEVLAEYQKITKL